MSAGIKPIDLTTYARQGLGFYTGDNADTTTDAQLRMSILRNGNVGIINKIIYYGRATWISTR